MNARRLSRRIVALALVVLMLGGALPERIIPMAVVHAAGETFPTGSPLGGGYNTRDIKLGDVNGDGWLDLLQGNQDLPVSLYLNTMRPNSPFDFSGSEIGTAQNTGTLALGDVNNDGRLDLVQGIREQGTPEGVEKRAALLYLNTGIAARPFTTSAPVGSPQNTSSLALGDINGDGFLDLVQGSRGAPSLLYLNNRTATPFANVLGIAVGGEENTSRITLGDVSGDGRLDIVQTNNSLSSNQSVLFINSGVDTSLFPANGSPIIGSSGGAAVLGDVDGDERLDLVIGAAPDENQLYLNSGNATTPFSTTMLIGGSGNTSALTLGDVDTDGDLDLVRGIFNGISTLYSNNGTSNPFGDVSGDTIGGQAAANVMALGDVDNDGDLDLVQGNFGTSSLLYLNTGATTNLFRNGNQVGASSGGSITRLADVTGDGRLDLLHGDGLYVNGGTATPFGTAASAIPTNGNVAAIGDVDNNGKLDLVQGGYGVATRVYLHSGEAAPFAGVAGSLVNDARYTYALALGDVNGDNWLDLVQGNSQAPSMLYLNNHTATPFTKADSQAINTSESFGTAAVALGDVDADGDLDLVADTDEVTRLYLNTGSPTAPFSGQGTAIGNGRATNAVVLADVDDDGDLDLIQGNGEYELSQASLLYLNNGTLAPFTDVAGITIGSLPITRAIAAGDVDGDGDLDLILMGDLNPAQLHLNVGSKPNPFKATATFGDDQGVEQIALGDVDGDGDDDLIKGLGGAATLYLNTQYRTVRLPNTQPTVAVRRPGRTPSAPFYSTSQLLEDRIVDIPYTLSDLESDAVARVRAFYSLDGGANWRPAIPTDQTQRTNLATSPTGVQHTFSWNTYASDDTNSRVFGQSDNVVVRIEADPGYSNARSVAGPFQRAYTAATTTPFRLRGTQSRALRDGQPLFGAQVYRLPAGAQTGAKPVVDSKGRSYRTNHLGYLEGRGIISLNDRLIALQPLPTPPDKPYSLFYTSAAPNDTGLDAHTVTHPGVQTLNVSADNPLMLLKLSVSLEWDARGNADAEFMRLLRQDLERVSTSLYDWSDGQIALGDVTIYHNKERWHDKFDAQGNLTTRGADIRVRATNALRPNASQGGITTREFTETLTLADGTSSTVVYEPGHVRIGAVWNSDGWPEQRPLNIDWARALAHELGHYALYLDDNYIGLNDAKQIVPVTTCLGAMSDPYAAESIDFRPDNDWLPSCTNTLSNRSTGRSDWSTIKRFYDDAAIGLSFNQPNKYNDLKGPSTLPLAVLNLKEGVGTATAATRSLPVSATGGSYDASPSARAFVFRNGGSQILDLGKPTSSQVPGSSRVLARGIESNDQVCLYDLRAGKLGCVNGSASPLALSLSSRGDWQPDVVLTPIDPRTLEVSVVATDVGSSPPAALKARLFPSDSDEFTVDADLTLTAGSYVGRFNLSAPVLEGYVRVWVDEAAPRREIVTDYSIGGNPAPPRRPPRRSRRKAPVISSDGQVILFTDGLDFKKGEFFSIQQATRLPPSPPTARPIGLGYRLIASNPAPSLAGVGINMAFGADELPTGADGWVTLYYFPQDGSKWQPLTPLPGTKGATEINAQVKGPGLYVLMASVPFDLPNRGWNQKEYQGATAPLPDALTLVAGSYSHMYGYDDTDESDPWKLYVPKPDDQGIPTWLNQLTQLEHGELYRFYVTEPLTATIRPPALAAARAEGSLPIAPATFYGTLAPRADFTPQEGMPVEAYVNGTLCGETKTKLEGGKVVVDIDVFASDSGPTANCGTDGAPVTITIGDYEWPARPAWDNTRLNELRIYTVLLPVVRDGRAPVPVTTPEPEEPEED